MQTDRGLRVIAMGLRPRCVVPRAVELLRLAARLSQLAPGARLRAVVVLRVLAVSVVCNVPALRRRGVVLTISIAGIFRRLRVADRTELETLRAMALEGAWQDGLPDEAAVVLDLGAHIGLTAVVYRSRYPNARIIAVEPDPETCARLRANVEGLSIEVVQAAVCDSNGPVAFFPSRASWASSLNGDEGSTAPTTVTGVTLDRLLHDHRLGHVDLLKVNVEGAEFEIFATLADHGRLGYVLGEFHGDATEGEKRLRQALPGMDLWFGYDGYAMTFRVRSTPHG